MEMTSAIPASTHAFADGSYKKMLIDGQWVDALSGKRFESRNPATGELLATIAEGDKADIDRAVAAARKAFDGPWSAFTPYERQRLLLKFGDLVEQHFDELSTLDTARHGRAAPPDARPAPARARHDALLRRPGDRDPRRDDSELAARRDLFLHAEGADRRRRRDHPVERAARGDGLEDRSGARDAAARSS